MATKTIHDGAMYKLAGTTRRTCPALRLRDMLMEVMANLAGAI